MAGNTAVTVFGAAGSLLSIPLPVQDAADGGTATVAGAAIDELNAAIVNGSVVPVLIAGNSGPAQAAGVSDAAVITIPGAAFVEPPGYSAILDAASGATTILANGATGQLILAGTGPVAVRAAGGGGSILSGAGSSSFALASTDFRLAASGGGNTVTAAGGTDVITLIDPANLVYLGDGSQTLAGAGNDTIATGAGDYALTVEGGSRVFTGSGNARVMLPYYKVSPVFGPSRYSGDNIVVAAGAGNTTVEAIEGTGALIQNSTGHVVVRMRPQVLFNSGRESHADSVFGGSGSVTVTGGDFALGPSPYDALLVGGTAGSNLLVAAGQEDIAFGAGDGDVLIAGSAFDTLVAGAGAETLFSSGNFDVLFGGSGPGVIVAGASDTIVSGQGDTTISTLSNSPKSLVSLGNGRSIVQLQAAPVNLIFGDTGDTLVAGAGAAIVHVDHSALVFGGSGALLFVGGDGPSTLAGGRGAVTAFGGTAGGDLLVGGTAGGSILQSGGANTTLVGGGSGDSLFAHAGGNILVAGPGAATLVGGDGADSFVIRAGHAGGGLVIGGFQTGSDHVVLQGYASDAAAAALAGAVMSGDGSTTINLDDGTRVTFLGVSGLTKDALV